MKSSDLRGLQPFFAAVEGYAEALSRDTSACRCSLNTAGRWERPSSGCVGEDGCRQVLHIIVRVHLARIRMGVDHITDPELDTAVEQLRALCLQAPQLSPADFADSIQRSLHGERVAGDRS